MDRPAVDRSGLESRILHSGASVVEIVAPAGFGKTFIARRVSGPLGARIAADCRDMETLPSAVRAALRALWPFEPAFEARLGRYLVALDPSDPSPSLWLDVLDEALAQERDGRACWIDNAEGLKTLRWGALVVDRLIAKGVRLLICSRQPPSLPSLSRVPPNERYSVGVRDLRFSDAESAALFPRGTDPQSVQHALAAAQGWPIAVLSYVRAAREDGLEGLLAGVDRTYRSRQLDQYVLKEALSGFSSRALTTLAAIAQLRACAEPDLEALTDGAPEIVEELHRSPFVDWTRGPIEVHALASAALVPRLREARALLREAAARTGDPLRAARLYMAGGDPESAASRLDTVLAPYFLGESSGEFVDIVSSLGRDVLTRHAATWSATITLRAYAMSQHELLAESRAAWAALPDDAPLPLRIGVGLTLANSLLFLNHIEEADSVFDALQRRVDASGAPEAGKAVAAYRAFGTLRGGRRVDADAIMQGMEPLFRAVPESHASALISFAGPADFMRGDRDAARRAFSRGLEIARGVAPPVYLAIGLCNAAFHAWLAGETALFDSCVEELVATSRPIVIGGTRHFIACATSPRPATAVPSYELHYLRAFGYIIAAAREPDAAAKAAATRLALDAAEEDGQPWLRAFCHAVIAYRGRGQSPSHVEAAHSLAATLEYPSLRDAITTLADGNVPERWPGLRVLVNASADPLLEISLLANQVILDKQTILLSRREMELVLALALHEGARDRQTLAAMLWPDTPEGDGAAAATVYVARLRRRLGRAELIESTRSGYRLHCQVELDLQHLERMAASGDAEPADPRIERLLRSNHGRFAQWMLMSDWLAPYVRRYAAAVEAVRRRRAERAESDGDAPAAALYRQLLAAETAAEAAD